MSEIKPALERFKAYCASKGIPEKSSLVHIHKMSEFEEHERKELLAAYEALQKENAELKEAAKYSEHIDATPANQRETMLYDTLIERDVLKAESAAQSKRLEEAVDRIKDMLKNDDGQAHKEARRFIESLPEYQEPTKDE